MTQSSLSFRDMYGLEKHFSNLKPKEDILTSSPLEIVLSIAEYLDLEDVLACLLVSKTWRSKFFEGRVMFSVIRQYFPSLTWTDPDPDPDLAQPQQHARRDYRALFCQAMQQRHNRHQGLCKSVLLKKYCYTNDHYFRLDPRMHPSAEPGNSYPHNTPDLSMLAGDDEFVGDQCCYSNGRVAWSTYRNSVVLDDLRTGLRKIYAEPDDRLTVGVMSLRSLGNELVVATIGVNLLAWDYKSDKFDSVVLPNAVRRCVTEGSRVAVVTRDNRVLVWRFGGALLELDYSQIPQSVVDRCTRSQQHFLDNLDVILHTHEQNTLFIVTAYPVVRNASLVSFDAYEFDDSNYIASHRLTLPTDSENVILGDNRGSYDVLFRIKPQKVNAFGLFGISTVLSFPSDPKAAKTLRHLDGLVVFDIFNRKLSTQRYKIPMDLDSDSAKSAVFHGSQYWNECFVLQARYDDRLTHGSAIIPVCQRLRSTTGEKPGRTRMIGLEHMYMEGEPQFRDPTPDRLFRVFQEHKISSTEFQCCYLTRPMPYTVKVMGDDDFMVSFAGNGYISWSFHSNFDEEAVEISYVDVVFGRALGYMPHGSELSVDSTGPRDFSEIELYFDYFAGDTGSYIPSSVRNHSSTSKC
ncbi:hypothetical protein AAE478_005755 [Parahypoxylon ruwenzoriense]